MDSPRTPCSPHLTGYGKQAPSVPPHRLSSLLPYDRLDMFEYISNTFYASSRELYDQSANVQSFLLESLPIATSIIDHLISLGGEMLYSKYLDSKNEKYSLQRTFTLIEHAQLQNYITHDAISPIIEDSEPIIPPAESWRALDAPVNIKVRLKPLQPIESSRIIDGIEESSQRQLRRQPSMKSSIGEASSSKAAGVSLERNPKRQDPAAASTGTAAVNSIFAGTSGYFGQFSPQVQSIRTEEHLDRVEEQLRLLKQRETTFRQERESADAAREIEMKVQQNRVKLGRKQNSSSDKFTFDFNGTVISQENVNVDKLPATTLLISHAISAQTQQSTSGASLLRSQQIPSEIAVKKEKVVQIVRGGDAEKQKETAAATTASVFQSRPGAAEMYEKFMASKGVTYIEGQKVKQGAKFQADINQLDIMNSSRSAAADTSGGGGGLFLSRDQYKSLFPFEQQSPRFMFESIHTSHLPRISTETGEESSSNNDNQVKTRNMKTYSDHHASRSQHHQLMLPGLTKLNKIKIESSRDFAKKLLDKFDSDDAERPFLTARNRDITLKSLSIASPTDTFNSAIIAKKALWGIAETSTAMTTPATAMIGLSTKLLKTQKNFKEKHSLGNVSQFPRERLSKASLAVQTHSHLASPRVGHTMGHGFVGESYNPHRILTDLATSSGFFAKHSIQGVKS